MSEAASKFATERIGQLPDRFSSRLLRIVKAQVVPLSRYRQLSFPFVAERGNSLNTRNAVFTRLAIVSILKTSGDAKVFFPIYKSPIIQSAVKYMVAMARVFFAQTENLAVHIHDTLTLSFRAWKFSSGIETACVWIPLRVPFVLRQRVVIAGIYRCELSFGEGYFTIC